MALPIYKPGQGYWTRVLSVAGVFAVTLAGAKWVTNRLARHASAFGDHLIFYQAGVFVLIAALTGLLCWWLIGRRPNIVNFMIATEAEMKKVNWPSRREIVGSTVVVIGGTLLMAALLFVVNLLFGAIFLRIGILSPEAV